MPIVLYTISHLRFTVINNNNNNNKDVGVQRFSYAFHEICIFPYSISTNMSSIDIRVYVLKLCTVESHMRQYTMIRQISNQFLVNTKIVVNMYTQVTENFPTKNVLRHMHGSVSCKMGCVQREYINIKTKLYAHLQLCDLLSKQDQICHAGNIKFT